MLFEIITPLINSVGICRSAMGRIIDDDMGEDLCFSCKDGGDLRVCDFKNCRKAYHPNCVQKDESFLVDDNKWECPWHSCSICNKEAVFQCYCCPTSSVCRTCVKEAEFAPVRNNNKGFCRMCLRLTILIEEITDNNSDGEKIDFDDPENLAENLFRDYWYIIKDNELLTPSDLKAAKRRFNQTGTENKSISEEDYDPTPEPDSSASFLPEEESRKRKSKPKLKVDSSLSNKKCKSKMRSFTKWGSEELIGFLVSIGREAEVPLSQGDVETVVKEYTQRNNLYEPGKKKKKFVLCDERLRALFGKRRVKFNRIYKMLDKHFPGGQDDVILFSDSDEEPEEESVSFKKRKVNMGGTTRLQHVREQISEDKKACTATLVRGNIKLIYLRQALVLQFLKNPDTFEQKIIGCFVRVKHHPKEFYGTPPNLYQIGQVTDVKKDTEMYQVGGMSTDIVIRVSNIHKDIKLSSLADDDFGDEDVEDLRKLVQKGLYKMPTVGEVAEKLKYVHEDITGYWIEKELARLTKLKQLASEKGWRREMFEYISRIDLLRKPEEQERLKKEMPLILADSEEEKDEKEEKEEATITSLSNSLAQSKVDAKTEANHQKLALEGGENAWIADNVGIEPETSGGENARIADNVGIEPETSGNGASEVPVEELDSKERIGNGASEVPAEELDSKEKLGNSVSEVPVEELDSKEKIEVRSPGSLKSNSGSRPMQPNKAVKRVTAMIPVIDISDSDSDSDSEDAGSPQMPSENIREWYYLDPMGMQHGPFSMKLLRTWEQKGFFDKNFEVWRVGQSIRDAILLSEASRNTM
ncbi:uncharacterized protein At5g08430-like isoform X6 [Carex rostrata]